MVLVVLCFFFFKKRLATLSLKTQYNAKEQQVKRKNRPEIGKVLPNSTNISQKYRKPFFFFFMQFVPVFMPGVSLESMFIIFPKNTL